LCNLFALLQKTFANFLKKGGVKSEFLDPRALAVFRGSGAGENASFGDALNPFGFNRFFRGLPLTLRAGNAQGLATLGHLTIRYSLPVMSDEKQSSFG
jgi:hypothetical protein